MKLSPNRVHPKGEPLKASSKATNLLAKDVDVAAATETAAIVITVADNQEFG